MLYKRFLKSIQTSYKNKLTLVFSIAILIPVIFVFIAALVLNVTQTEKSIIEKINIAESDQSKKLDTAVNDMYSKLSYLANYNTLSTVLETDYEPSLTQMLDIKEKISEMETLFSLASTENLILYTTNKNLRDTSILKTVTDKEIIQLCNAQNTCVKIEKINNVLSLSVYKQYGTLYNKNHHLLNISVPVSSIFDNTSYMTAENLYFYYADKNNNFFNIISSKNKNSPDTEEYLRKGSIKDFYVHKMNLSYVDGNFYIFKNIQKERYKNLLTAIAFCLVFLLFAVTIFFFTHLLSRVLTNRLTSIIEEIETDDIKIPPSDKNNLNEFYKIHTKLYDLSSELKSENEKILKYELELLNQKISPHFLYNNLSAIKFNCSDENLEEIIDLLSDYYRESFHKNTTSTLIKDEMRRIELYVTLLKFAYEQNFSYSFEVDEKLLEISILSDIIQPLIENAFIHSLNNTEENTAYIKVKISREDNNLFIEIKNNHFNSEDSDITSIQSTADNKKSALFIIQKRINLYYGESYGITFSKDNDVLTALIKLPYID